eukprot:SAG11_NODE_20973_length_434_cov_1.528358_1_plen_82_part_01
MRNFGEQCMGTVSGFLISAFGLSAAMFAFVFATFFASSAPAEGVAAGSGGSRNLGWVDGGSPLGSEVAQQQHSPQVGTVATD